VGLCLSVVLFLLTPVITLSYVRRRNEPHPESSYISSLGVLEVLWLSNLEARFDAARKAVATVDDPSTNNLRVVSLRNLPDVDTICWPKKGSAGEDSDNEG
jgi:hypothetical protein